MKLDWKFYLGLVIGAFFLYLAMRKLDYAALWGTFSLIRWPMIVVSVFVYYLTYLIRTIRWRYLAMPIKRMRLRSIFSATAIGFGANNMFPARLGEIIRCIVLGRMERVRASAVLATVVVERLFDMLAVLVMLGLVLVVVPFPGEYQEFQRGLRATGVMSLGGVAGVFVFLVFLGRESRWAKTLLSWMIRPVPVRWRERAESMALSFAGGLAVLFRRDLFFPVIVTTVLHWLTVVGLYYAVFLAFGFVLPVFAAVFLTVLLAFAVAIPSTPGYIGPFHAAARYALVFFGLPAEEAVSVGIVMHAVNFLPAIAGGLLFIWIDKVNIGGLYRESAAGVTPKMGIRD